jgi:hypothetical protein
MMIWRRFPPKAPGKCDSSRLHLLSRRHVRADFIILTMLSSPIRVRSDDGYSGDRSSGLSRYSHAVLFWIFALLITFLPSESSTAQSSDAPRNSGATIYLEPAGLGLSATAATGDFISIGISTFAGRQFAPVLHWYDYHDVTSWANGYLLISARLSRNVAVLVKPIGGAVVSGNDWGTVFPSGAIGLQILSGRIRFSSEIRAVRVAGGNGLGEYHVSWVPIRLGWMLSK